MKVNINIINAVAHRVVLAVFFSCALTLLPALQLRAEDIPPEIHLVNGRFAPAELVVPANTPFKLRVSNADKAAIEFESFELHRERVVQPDESITVYIPA